MKIGTRVIYWPKAMYSTPAFAGQKATILEIYARAEDSLQSADIVQIYFDNQPITKGYAYNNPTEVYISNIRELHEDCDQNDKLLAECPHCNGK
jgi:hypothetical protein